MACDSLPIVFLRKNWLYLRFNILALFVIFFGCFGILCLYLKSTYEVHTSAEPSYETENYLILKQNYFPANEYDLIYYAPKTDAVDALMERVRLELDIIPDRLNASSTAQMEQQCTGTCFAIEFEQVPERGHDGNGNGKLVYSISSNQLRISPKKRYVNDDEVNTNKGNDDYIRAGFLTLQYTIDQQYLQSQGYRPEFEVEFTSMPSTVQQYMDSNRLLHFGTIFTVLFSVLLLSTFLVPLVEEKQDGLKEFLTLATPMSFLNGLTFFVIRLVLYSCFLFGVLAAAFCYRALGLAHFAYMAVLFLLYIVAEMSYAYLISVCFNSVFYAKVGGLLLLIIPYIFYLVKGGLSCVAVFMFSTKTFMEGLDVFQTYTNKHHQFVASDLFEQVKENTFSIFSVYAILIVQTFAYALLYNYLAYVFPGPGGLKRHFLFFLNPAFYKKRQRNEYTTAPRGADAIIIQDLVKKFNRSGREVQISDRLNMTIKNKQITVLLGHNGAGKTTTLNMIMGLEPKDAGKIIVCSERDVASYRHLIGFCPQHSVFMNYMTCKEHLVFFAQLRGMSQTESEFLAKTLLHQLKLADKEAEYGKNLSGGMKRRLSLGIALAGETKVVVLDEPSSGLDIESRRELWDILLDLRKTKAVLATTHYMEEAEVLGDTICILANGRLQRTGTPLELKRKYGSGYRLKLCTNGGRYNEQETLRQIQQTIPTARVLHVVPPTVYISLPYVHKPNYHAMLLELEQKRDSLGIASISITDTSLEDVFLSCASVDQVDTPDCSRVDITNLPYEPLHNPTKINWLQQLSAIAYKKCTFLRNEWLYTMIMLAIPFVCAAFAIFLMHAMSVVANEHVLPLKLAHIGEGTIYIYNPTSQHASIERLLFKQITQQGINATKLTLTGGNSVVDELMSLQKQNFADFLQNVIGVIDMSGQGQNGNLLFHVFNSGNIYHSSVILLNLIDSTMLQASNALAADADIVTTYVPIRKFITDVSPTRLEYYAVIVSIGMFFSMFYYVSLPFREHVSGFKELQAMPRHTYWLSTFACDLTLHFCICVALYVLQRAIMSHELYNAREQFVIIASIFFYGCSYLPVLYCFANSFKSISTISTYLLFMLVVSAIVPLITSSNVRAMKYHETKIMFLSLLPDFNLNHQLRVLNENFIINRSNAASLKDAAHTTPNVTKAQQELSLGDFFVNALLLTVCALAFLIGVLEHKYKRQWLSDLFMCRSCSQPKTATTPTDEVEEWQCSEESQHVADILASKSELEYPLIVSTLRKHYNRKSAVRDLSFAVKKGECFGLLGVNGAGKTTTFQMIGANVTITDGTIKIDGTDIRDNEIQYRYRFGYCPQYDSLNNFMTAKQSLNFMAMLRGLSGKSLTSEVYYWLEKMDIAKYKNVQIRHYSGGTKRKLLAALAMIGSPSLVLLDEPTTGVDPVSRRFLWKCIQDFQKHNKTIVLTSHSMDECEQLCNRLAIMAHGKFKCLGGICELKVRYGSGFTIKVKLQDDAVDDVKQNATHIQYVTQSMSAYFAESVLREHHAGMLTYFVRSVSHVEWSSVFKRTEQFLHDVNSNANGLIEAYSVNESTLEDIFLKFDTRNKRQSSFNDANDARIEEV